MKAIVIDGAGGPEVLHLREVPDPQLAAGEILIDGDSVGAGFRGGRLVVIGLQGGWIRWSPVPFHWLKLRPHTRTSIPECIRGRSC